MNAGLTTGEGRELKKLFSVMLLTLLLLASMLALVLGLQLVKVGVYAVSVFAQEPPLPPFDEPPFVVPTPLLFVAVIIAAAGVAAWKYKAVLEFLVLCCSTAAGFIIGFVGTPPYANVGLAMFGALAGLLISIAIVTSIRLLKTKR